MIYSIQIQVVIQIMYGRGLFIVFKVYSCTVSDPTRSGLCIGQLTSYAGMRGPKKNFQVNSDPKNFVRLFITKYLFV